MKVYHSPPPGQDTRLATPSLDAWRKELRAGERTKDTLDVLWRCACADANALEMWKMRLPEVAYAIMRDTRAYLRQVARAQGVV